MEVVLRQLARFGFRDVTVITGYLTELIEAFFGDGRKFGARLTYRREVTPLGTAGRPGLLDRPEEPVLVINGDILTTLDFAAMYRFHRDRGAAATIASYPREVKIDFGVLEFGDDPHVLTGYREKPEFSFQVSMGLYILDPVAWDFLEAGPALQMPDLLETMRARAGRSTASRSRATGSTSAGMTTTRPPTRSSRPVAGRSSATLDADRRAPGEARPGSPAGDHPPNLGRRDLGAGHPGSDSSR